MLKNKFPMEIVKHTHSAKTQNMPSLKPLVVLTGEVQSLTVPSPHASVLGLLFPSLSHEFSSSTLD